MGITNNISSYAKLSPDKLLDQRSTYARRYAWIVLFIGIASFIGNALTAILHKNWQMGVMTASAFCLIALAISSIIASRRKKLNLAALLMSISGVLIVIPSAFVIEGMGVASGVASILVTTVIAVQVASGQYQTILSFLGIGSGICAILVQLFVPAPYRVPMISPFVLGLIIVGSVVTTVVFLLSQYAKFPIRVKFLIAFLLLSLFSIFTIALATYFTTRRALVNSLGERISSISDAKALAVGEYFSRNIDLVKVLAINPEIIKSTVEANAVYMTDEGEKANIILELNKEWITSKQANDHTDPLVKSRLQNPIVDILTNFQRLYPDHFYVNVVDKFGALVASTNFTQEYFHGDEDWFIAAFNAGRSRSVPKFDSNTSTYTFEIATPVIDPATNLLSGVVHSTLHIQTLIEILTEGTSTIADSDLVFNERNPKVLNENNMEFLDRNDLAVMNSILNKSFSEITLHQIPSLASVTSIRTSTPDPYINNMEIWVVTSQPSSIALAPVQSQINLIVLLAIVLSGVIGVAAIFIGNFLASPIMRLTKVAEQVAEGDLTIQANVKSQDEVGKLSSAFDDMTTRLRETIFGLEQRVSERTRAVELSATVSRRLSTILDLQQLIQAVVNEVQRSFSYYHAQIYLFDEAGEYLVMRGGTGEAGRVMLERGHKIAKGKGLVGQAAAQRKPVLTADTLSDPNWLPNPLLPDTRAEVAVPILIGEKVYGVLDIQHIQTYGLTEQDTQVLQSIASQVAIALQNAALFSQTQHQAQRETLVNTIAQQLQTSTSIDGVLQVLARELGMALQAKRVTAQMGKWELNARSEVIHQEGAQ